MTDITVFGGSSARRPGRPVQRLRPDDFTSTTPDAQPRPALRLLGGFDLDQRSNPICTPVAADRIQRVYLRDFQGGKGGVLENDDDNIGPRLGFTYDLKGDGRQLLRGGWGIYYDFPYTNATILFPSAAVQSNYGVVFNHHNDLGIKNPDGTFFQPGQPLPPTSFPAPPSRRRTRSPRRRSPLPMPRRARSATRC